MAENSHINRHIEKRPFGRTGHLSTRALFGAAAFSSVTQADADRTLDVLLQYGVNHIDTAASYGDSELRIAPWMARHRSDFFLATKTGKRTYAEAREELHRSLERLRTDHVDLIQLHALIDADEWKTAMGAGGALEALIEAREQGLTRYIGITGHELSIVRSHRAALEQFDFDSVLLPYSYMMMQDADYAREFDLLLATCRERNIAVQTIKAITRRAWGEGASRYAATWYEPLTEQAHIDTAVHWILRNDQVFLNTVGDVALLPKVLDAASRFDPANAPTDEAMRALVEELQMSPLFV
jgi:aryl-alcohol dehydrogenase-like predicted oxidoreductase